MSYCKEQTDCRELLGIYENKWLKLCNFLSPKLNYLNTLVELKSYTWLRIVSYNTAFVRKFVAKIFVAFLAKTRFFSNMPFSRDARLCWASWVCEISENQKRTGCRDMDQKSNMPLNWDFPHLWTPKIFFLKTTFELQVTIPSEHPVQISSRLDYCITLS